MPRDRGPVQWLKILGVSFWILLLVTGTVIYLLGRAWLGEYLRVQMEQLMARDFREEVLIERAGVDLLQGRVWFENVRWLTQGPYGKTVFARIDRIELRFLLRALLRRTLWIRELRLVRPRIQVLYDPRGRANWPLLRIPARARGPLRVHLAAITVEDLSFYLKHEGIPLLLGLEPVDARLWPHPGSGQLMSAFRFERGFLQMHSYNPWQFQGGLQAALDLDGIRLYQAHFFGQGYHLWGHGRVRGYGAPQFDLTISGRWDNRVIQQVHNIAFRVQGQARGIVHYDGDFSRFRMLGWLASEPFRMGRMRFDRVASPVYMSHHRLELQGMTGTTCGGRLVGTFRIDPLFGQSGFFLRLAGRNLDADEFGRMWGLRYVRHGARWSGAGGITWTEDNFPRLTGWTFIQAHAMPPPAPPPRPVRGDPPVYLREWGYPVDLEMWGELDGFAYRHIFGRGRLGALRGSFDGRIDFDGGLNVQVQAETASIFELDVYYHQWYAALFPDEIPAIELWDMDGRGTFTGRLSNRVQDIAIDGHFRGQRMRYFGVVWGDVDTEVHYWHRIFHIHRGVLTDGPYRAEADDAFIYLGEIDFAVDGDAYADIRFLGYPVERVLAPTPLHVYPLQGSLRGLLTVRGNYQQVDLWGDLNLTNGAFGKIPLDYGILRFSYVNFLFQAQEGRVAYQGGLIDFSGRWSRLDGRFEDFHVRIRELPLGPLPVLENADIDGYLNLEANLNGSYLHPRVEVDGVVRDLTWRGDPLGTLRLFSTAEGLQVSLAIDQDGATRGSGTLRWDAEPRRFSLDWTLDRLRLPRLRDTYLRGHGTLTGTLDEAGTPEADLRIEAGRLDLQGFPVTLAQPVTWRFRDRTLDVAPTRFSFDPEQLVLQGQVAFRDHALEASLQLRGEVPAPLFQILAPDIRTEGTLDLDLSLRLRHGQPILRGTVRVRDGIFATAGWPTTLRDLRAQIRIDENVWSLDRLVAQMGPGTLQAQGRVVWTPGAPRPEIFQIDFTGDRLLIQLPTQGYVQVSGRGTLTGFQDSLMLTADWTIPEGTLAWDWSLPSVADLFRSREPLLPFTPRTQGNTWLPRLRLNVRTRVTTPIPVSLTVGSLQLTSNLTWNLQMTGTGERPSLIGVANFQGGQLILLNRIFNITEGQIQFVNPLAIRPLIRFQAETQVQSFLIRILIRGPLDRINVQFTSDPPLPQATILNLLGGQTYIPGQSPRENTGFYTGLGSNFLFTILAQPLTRPAQRFLGIDRLTLDISQLGPEAQPVPRLTIGKSISNRWYVTYSIGLAAIQNQIWLIEYSLGESARMIVSLDEEGFWGIDFFLRP